VQRLEGAGLIGAKRATALEDKNILDCPHALKLPMPACAFATAASSSSHGARRSDCHHLQD
jgi:hypothetical protein